MYHSGKKEGKNCLVRILTWEFQVKAAKTICFNDSFFANCMINIFFLLISGLESWRRCWRRQTLCFKSSVRCVQLSKGTNINSFHSFQCTNKHISAVEAKFTNPTHQKKKIIRFTALSLSISKYLDITNSLKIIQISKISWNYKMYILFDHHIGECRKKI